MQEDSKLHSYVAHGISTGTGEQCKSRNSFRATDTNYINELIDGDSPKGGAPFHLIDVVNEML